MNRRQFIKLSAAIPQTCQQIAAKYELECSKLDQDARYMVIVRPDAGQDFTDRRLRQEIVEEIRDCFQSAGIARGDVGVVLLRGYSIEIVQVVEVVK